MTLTFCCNDRQRITGKENKQVIGQVGQLMDRKKGQVKTDGER
jgi:hypothetical protein